MCRDFEPLPIAEHLLEQVLRSAFRGPSAGNTAGLDLLVLTGESVTGYWDVTLPSQTRPHFRWPGLLRAPVLIIPVVDPGAYVHRYSRRDKGSTGLGESASAWPVPYWFVDGGAAVMSMLLAAESLELGALLFGQFEHEQAVAERFGIPPSRRAVGTLALGHPAAGGRRPSVSARKGRADPESHTHRNHW